MKISQYVHDGKATIALSGQFVFTAHREFRDKYQALLGTPEIKALDIDMEGVDYLDSSALGSLLLVKELAASHNVKLGLTRCRGMVLAVLNTANFDKIFTITT